MQHIISSSPILLLTSRALAGMGLPLARIVIDAGRKKININWRVLDLGNLKKNIKYAEEVIFAAILWKFV